MNKDGDEVYCEVINKDLPGGNEGLLETSQNTENLRPYQGSKGEPLEYKPYPMSQVLGMSSFNPLNWSQPLA